MISTHLTLLLRATDLDLAQELRGELLARERVRRGVLDAPEHGDLRGRDLGCLPLALRRPEHADDAEGRADAPGADRRLEAGRRGALEDGLGGEGGSG